MWACTCNREQKGLADVLVSPQVHLRSAERLRELCCANRGTFIKVGQHLGALDYLLPEEYTRTLKVLHNQAPQSTRQEIEQVIREDLGKEVGEALACVGFSGLSKPWAARGTKTGVRRTWWSSVARDAKGRYLLDPGRMPCEVSLSIDGHYWQAQERRR